MTPFPPPAGGVATWARRLVDSSLSQRFELRVVNTSPGAKGGASLDKVAHYARVPWRVLRELLTFRPDLVHLNSGSRMPHTAYEDAALIQPARRLGARVVLHFRGSTLSTMLDSPLSTRLLRRALRHADAAFALHKRETALLAENGARQALQVSNFVPSRPWREHPAPDGPIRILYVGWMIHEKGIFELLDALATVPGAVLDLVGRFTAVNGKNCEAEFHARIDALGLRERVTLHGEVPLATIWEHYDRADVFVLPSWTEGFPNVLAEAMVSGLPCVCTPVGAIPEVLVDGETGIIVPKQDARALGEALGRLVSDSDLRHRMGRAGWQRAMDVYEQEAVLNRIGDAWDALIDGRPLTS